MEVKFLKAGTGDSILVHHDNHNILIDGGNDSKYLLMEIADLHAKGEKIDLMILTHHDDDHIKGIIDVLDFVKKGEFGLTNEFIKRVIFNSPRTILREKNIDNEHLLSYKQAFQVEELLKELSIKCEKCTENSPPVIFGDLKITFLAPTEEILEKYSEDKGAYLSSDYKCDWKSPLQLLEKYISDDSQDTSLSNRSSIVIKLECEGKKILLTGDATPDRLEYIISKLAQENNGSYVSFDYIKLPHHGSYRSLNKAIIEKTQCQKYIICTDSKKHFLPNKRALLKVLQFAKREKRQVQFLFNYEQVLPNLEFTDKEKKEYNFSAVGPNYKNGINI